MLGRRLSKNPVLHAAYRTEISGLINNGYAERVPDPEEVSAHGRVWYLLHHNVVNPNKPEKFRVVFDCAAKCQEVSLNQKVLQGPDLMNKLVGVLLRFRRFKIAMVADIKSMFHQVRVSPSDRDVLRFLWVARRRPTEGS